MYYQNNKQLLGKIKYRLESDRGLTEEEKHAGLSALGFYIANNDDKLRAFSLEPEIKSYDPKKYYYIFPAFAQNLVAIDWMLNPSTLDTVDPMEYCRYLTQYLNEFNMFLDKKRQEQRFETSENKKKTASLRKSKIRYERRKSTIANRFGIDIKICDPKRTQKIPRYTHYLA